MSSTDLSAVLVGYGSIGRFHARVLSQRYPRLAIVDSSESVRMEAAQAYPGVAVAESLADLATGDWPWETTLAVIATWGPSHAPIFHDLSELGVLRVLCEKPLANSVRAGYEMVAAASDKGIALGVHQHLRYSGFVPGLRTLAGKLGLGEPTTMFVQGGAIGLVNRGIHWIDVACELFGRGPESVVGSVTGQPINPRSSELMFYGGTAAWDFGDGREASFSLTNGSSVDSTVHVFYRNAVVEVHKSLNLKVRTRTPSQVEAHPQVTRVGDAAEVVFDGPLDGVRPSGERTNLLLDEIEAGRVEVFPPELALQALGACIGAIAAGRDRRAVSLPIDPESEIGRTEWPIS
ncbi:MAG: Gfo/Idh/MocA family oxidoreductase [Chloroflexi bacterium]|nr:Gfo/Idh/MocA family oxidoreductase [Chloroflexota bacterium]